MGTVLVSLDGVTAEQVNASFAEAGFGTRVHCLTDEEREASRLRSLAWNAPEAVLARKLDLIRASSEDDLAAALRLLPRARRRAAARHGLLTFMHGGLLPREIDAVYAYLTDYPDDY